VVAVVLLVVTLALSLTITRVATVALVLTGMSEEAAHFQARSAFYGVGFTTAESELVVNHPVRRRIVTLLMLLGNLGVATGMASVLGSILTTNSPEAWGENLRLLAAGLGLLLITARSRWLYRIMSGLVAWALRKWTTLDVNDYVALLNLSAGYTVIRLEVQRTEWLVGRMLGELNELCADVLVLGLQHPKGAFLGVPPRETRIDAGDSLVLYGPIEVLSQLSAMHSPAEQPQVLHFTVAQGTHESTEQFA
jgi:hypothetical protein